MKVNELINILSPISSNGQGELDVKVFDFIGVQLFDIGTVKVIIPDETSNIKKEYIEISLEEGDNND